MLLVFICRLSEWAVLYVYVYTHTHIDLYVCVLLLPDNHCCQLPPLPEEKSHHAPAEGSRTLSPSSFSAANWHQEVVPPHNLSERFPCAVKKKKKEMKFQSWECRQASGMTPRLLCGSSSTGTMRLEVGMASRKLTAWYVCVLVSDESPIVNRLNH